MTNGELIGIVRLTTEEGVVVLRGMQVHPTFQRQGIGKRLLAAVAQELDGKGCFCIPYAHLVGFYGGIGFHLTEPAKAPDLSPAAAGEVSRPRRWERLSHHAPRRCPGSF